MRRLLKFMGQLRQLLIHMILSTIINRTLNVPLTRTSASEAVYNTMLSLERIEAIGASNGMCVFIINKFEFELNVFLLFSFTTTSSIN